MPEALLKAMQDNRLDVAKIALQSFRDVTEYKEYKSKYYGSTNPDDITRDMAEGIFGFDQAKEWWSKNKVEVDKKLKEQGTK